MSSLNELSIEEVTANAVR